MSVATVVKKVYSGKDAPEGVSLNIELRLTDIETLTQMCEEVDTTPVAMQNGYALVGQKRTTRQGPDFFKATLTPAASMLLAAAMAAAVRTLREEQIVEGLRGVGDLDLKLAGRRAIAFGHIQEPKK